MSSSEGCWMLLLCADLCCPAGKLFKDLGLMGTKRPGSSGSRILSRQHLHTTHKPKQLPLQQQQKQQQRYATAVPTQDSKASKVQSSPMFISRGCSGSSSTNSSSSGLSKFSAGDPPRQQHQVSGTMVQQAASSGSPQVRPLSGVQQQRLREQQQLQQERQQWLQKQQQQKEKPQQKEQHQVSGSVVPAAASNGSPQVRPLSAVQQQRLQEQQRLQQERQQWQQQQRQQKQQAQQQQVQKTKQRAAMILLDAPVPLSRRP